MTNEGIAKPGSKAKRKGERRSVGREVMSWIGSLALALACALIIRTFLFTLIGVDGDSMKDTLMNGDRLYVSILSAKIEGYQRGDVVICHYPGADHQCVKRIIAIPGDALEIVRGVPYVNGEAVQEEYLAYHATYNYGRIELGEGEYFVLGDNRPISKDSHSQQVGPITDIIGKVRFIFWPLDRFGAVD